MKYKWYENKIKWNQSTVEWNKIDYKQYMKMK